MIRSSQFHGVLNTHARPIWLRNRSRWTIWSDVRSPTGLWKRCAKMINFIPKSSSVTKLIFGSMGSLISKICVIGRVKIHMCFIKHHFIQKNNGLVRFACRRRHKAIFFVDDNDRHVTVNGNRYRGMITDYFWPELEDMNLDNMWFQHSTVSHSTRYNRFIEE